MVSRHNSILIVVDCLPGTAQVSSRGISFIVEDEMGIGLARAAVADMNGSRGTASTDDDRRAA